MALSPKTRLGTYEILGPLGAGGMGEVYRAKDLRLGREVAVKVLPSEIASDPDRLGRFEREARTVAGLNHPNIVTLYSVEEERGIRFLTMELVEGQTLSTLVAPGGLPLPRLLELAIPLADALVAAHEKGVIHRDLKPENVMVTWEQRVKILDFGLAKLVSPDAPSEAATITAAAPVTLEGQVLGTMPYMAPEQVRGEAANTRTDLFALGVILYELTAGRRPFTGHNAADLTSSILRDTPEPLSQARTDCPVDLERIVSRCLEKNPRERFQTALDISNELRRLRHTLDHPHPDMGAPERIATIAVLPFVNRSRNLEDEYFSDGLAEDLLNVLARIKGLRVSARASSFRFKGKDASIAEVGKALNVAAILDGSVRKAGDRMRISVQLVKVSDGYQLWSGTYDRTLEDIFAVQDDIAQSVVKELRTMLLDVKTDSSGAAKVKREVAEATKGGSTNPEAYRLYLQARHFLGRYNREDATKGIAYLRQALDLDPNYARAWAGLGSALSFQADWAWAPVAKAFEQAREAVQRALSLEPDLPEGHTEMAWIQMLAERDWRTAESSFRRALTLAPGHASAVHGAGVLAYCQGRLQESIELYRRALELDPLDASGYSNLGLALLAAGFLEEAEVVSRRAVDFGPQRVGARAHLAMVLLARGREEEALAEAKRENHEGYHQWALAMIYYAVGQKRESNEALEILLAGDLEIRASQIAQIHAARGEVNQAFERLELAYEQQDSELTYIKPNLQLRSIHGDPRWGALMKKLGLEE